MFDKRFAFWENSLISSVYCGYVRLCKAACASYGVLRRQRLQRQIRPTKRLHKQGMTAMEGRS
jgi:hypothetical protein